MLAKRWICRNPRWRGQCSCRGWYDWWRKDCRPYSEVAGCCWPTRLGSFRCMYSPLAVWLFQCIKDSLAIRRLRWKVQAPIAFKSVNIQWSCYCCCNCKNFKSQKCFTCMYRLPPKTHLISIILDVACAYSIKVNHVNNNERSIWLAVLFSLRTPYRCHIDAPQGITYKYEYTPQCVFLLN